MRICIIIKHSSFAGLLWIRSLFSLRGDLGVSKDKVGASLLDLYFSRSFCPRNDCGLASNLALLSCQLFSRLLLRIICSFYFANWTTSSYIVRFATLLQRKAQNIDCAPMPVLHRLSAFQPHVKYPRIKEKKRKWITVKKRERLGRSLRLFSFRWGQEEERMIVSQGKWAFGWSPSTIDTHKSAPAGLVLDPKSEHHLLIFSCRRLLVNRPASARQFKPVLRSRKQVVQLTIILTALKMMTRRGYANALSNNYGYDLQRTFHLGAATEFGSYR